MKLARLLIIGLFAAATVVRCGDDNPTNSNGDLIGTWKVAKMNGEDYPFTVQYTFTKDGKFQGTGSMLDVSINATGTYRVEGKNLIITGSFMGENGTTTATFSISGNTLMLTFTEDGETLAMELRKI